VSQNARDDLTAFAEQQFRTGLSSILPGAHKPEGPAR